IDGLSTDAFDATEFTDEYRQRVIDMIQAKVEGKEIITLTPEAPKAQVIDLMEALKESLSKRVPKDKDKKPLAKAKKGETAAAARPGRQEVDRTAPSSCLRPSSPPASRYAEHDRAAKEARMRALPRPGLTS